MTVQTRVHAGAALNLPVLTAATAEPETAAMLGSVQKKLGFVPNMYGYMGYLPDLLSAYMGGYDAFRRNAGFTPVEQEVIFLAISAVNGCDYCVAAHSMLAERMSKVPPAVLAALRDGTTLPDPKLEALSRFTRRLVEARGHVTETETDAFLAAGYTPRHVFGIILAIGVKIFSNYTNHVAGTPIDAAFASYAVTA
jgi:uncharacterized peroxidase-related enzyme